MSGLLESLDRGEFIDEAVGFVAAVAPKLKAAVRLNISLPIKAGSGFMPPLTPVVPLPVNIDEGCVGTKQKAHQTKSKLFEEYGLSDSDALANSHTPHTLVTLEKTVGAYLPAPSLLLKSSSVILPKESSSIKKAKVTGPSPAGLTAFELFCEDHRDKRGGIPAMSYARLKEMWGSVDSEIFENYDSRVVERQLSGIGIPADIFSVKSVQKDGRGKQKPAPKIVSAVFSSASPPPSSLLPRFNSSKSRGKRSTIESDDDGEGGEEENWGSENDVLFTVDPRAKMIEKVSKKIASGNGPIVMEGGVVFEDGSDSNCIPRASARLNWAPYTVTPSCPAGIILPALYAWCDELEGAESGQRAYAQSALKVLGDLQVSGKLTNLEPYQSLTKTGVLWGTVVSLIPMADPTSASAPTSTSTCSSLPISSSCVPAKGSPWSILTLKFSLSTTLAGGFTEERRKGKVEEENFDDDGKKTGDIPAPNALITVPWLPPSHPLVNAPWVISSDAYDAAMASMYRAGSQVRVVFSAASGPTPASSYTNPKVATVAGEAYEGRVYSVMSRKVDRACGWSRCLFRAMKCVWYEQLAIAPHFPWVLEGLQSDNEISPWEATPTKLGLIGGCQDVFSGPAPALCTPMEVVNHLLKTEPAPFFLVLPSHEEAPTYASVIKNPITLPQILARCMSISYSPKDLWADLTLLIKNAKTFNDYFHVVWRMADALESEVRRLKKMFKGVSGATVVERAELEGLPIVEAEDSNVPSSPIQGLGRLEESEDVSEGGGSVAVTNFGIYLSQDFTQGTFSQDATDFDDCVSIPKGFAAYSCVKRSLDYEGEAEGVLGEGLSTGLRNDGLEEREGSLEND